MEGKQIAFIGTGVMGKSIVRHLLNASYQVTIYSRTKSKADELLAEGAIWADSVAEAVKNADVVFTMAGYPTDIEDIYFGENGVFKNSHAGQIVIDMTTSSPSLAIQIAKEASVREIGALDAPVSGGDIGARNGNLSIMCGGEKEVFDKAYILLSIFGNNIVYQGLAGAGQHAKMSNQIAIATNMIGVCEAIVYAEKAGLDPETVLRSISSGAAGSWSLSNLAPRMLGGDFEPGFYVKHFIKDMKIALKEAEQMNIKLPGLELAHHMYERLASKGFEDKGTQVLYKGY